MTLTMNRALCNVVESAFLHYINIWTMNRACVGHCAVLMSSMLEFIEIYGHYKCQENHLHKELKKKK